MNYKNNKLRFFSLVISICFLLSMLSACSNSRLPEFTETNSYFHLRDSAKYFPTYLAMQDDWFLVEQEISEFGYCKLVMFSVDGSKRYVLKKDRYFSFEYGYVFLSIVGDNVYYSTNYSINSHRFHQYNIRTRKDKVIANYSPKDYCADEKNVFVVIQPNEHYSLLKYSIADNSTSKIFDFDYEQVFLSQYALYYLLNDNIYRLDLTSDTYEPEQVIRLDSDIQVDQLAVYNGDIYINTGNAILCFPDGEQESYVIFEHQNIKTFSISQNCIIYESDDTPEDSSVQEIKLWVYDLITQKTKEVLSDDWIQFDVFGDKIVVRDNHYEQQPRYATINTYDFSGDLIGTFDLYMRK